MSNHIFQCRNLSCLFESSIPSIIDNLEISATFMVEKSTIFIVLYYLFQYQILWKKVSLSLSLALSLSLSLSIYIYIYTYANVRKKMQAKEIHHIIFSKQNLITNWNDKIQNHTFSRGIWNKWRSSLLEVLLGSFNKVVK